VIGQKNVREKLRHGSGCLDEPAPEEAALLEPLQNLRMIGIEGVSLLELLFAGVVSGEDENQLDLEAVGVDLDALLIADPFCMASLLSRTAISTFFCSRSSPTGSTGSRNSAEPRSGCPLESSAGGNGLFSGMVSMSFHLRKSEDTWTITSWLTGPTTSILK
jgi:hypothetical protein